jgi:hypothetical protein
MIASLNVLPRKNFGHHQVPRRGEAALQRASKATPQYNIGISQRNRCSVDPGEIQAKTSGPGYWK